MAYGVLILLDASGTRVRGEQLQTKVRNFDIVDEKIKKDIKNLRLRLGSYGYNDLLISGSIYDNIQIYLDLDLRIPRHVDYTGKNDFWWSITSMGVLSIDIFRYALINNIPLRGCITSAYGIISKSKRILGPIANEAAEFYEKADWSGIIASNHTGIVLNNKVELNPNRELFEPFIKYSVPVKACINNEKKIQKEEFWALAWPIQQAFKAAVSEKLIYLTPSNNEGFYGKTIKNSELEATLESGINDISPTISRKWKNTFDFYTYVVSKCVQGL